MLYIVLHSHHIFQVFRNFSSAGVGGLSRLTRYLFILIIIHWYTHHQSEEVINVVIFFVRKALMVLLVFSLLLLGGCVTIEKTENGTKLFDVGKNGSWEKFRSSVVVRLREGRGAMTMDEVRLLLPPPIIERDTGDLKAWGWYFHENKNSLWDFAVVSTSHGSDRLYLLTAVFTEKGILKDYEEQRAVIPVKKNTITSRPVVNELVAYQNMLILNRLIEGSLNRAADRGVDRADKRFSDTLDRQGTELANKVKNSVTNGIGGGASYTVTTTTPQGNPGTSRTTVTIH